MAISRGTTPELKFRLPVLYTDLASAFITMAQGNETVIEKKLSDCTGSGNVLSVRLTQADTLSLDHSQKLELQCRCKTTQDIAYDSNIKVVDVKRILKDGVI